MNFLISIIIIFFFYSPVKEKVDNGYVIFPFQLQYKSKRVYANDPKFNGKDEFYKNWLTVNSRHFIFHFPPNSLVTNKQQFADNHEQAYAKLNSFFNTSVPRKTDYFVWNYSQEAEKFGIGVLSFALPELCIIHVHAQQSIGHEITHIITHYMPGSTGIKTKFINEGIATYFDLNNRTVYGGPGFRKPDEKISLKEAWLNDYKYSDYVYYFLGGEVLKILNQKFGKIKLLQLIENQSYENAKKLYGKELDKVIEEVEKKVN